MRRSIKLPVIGLRYQLQVDLRCLPFHFDFFLNHYFHLNSQNFTKRSYCFLLQSDHHQMFSQIIWNYWWSLHFVCLQGPFSFFIFTINQFAIGWDLRLNLQRSFLDTCFALVEDLLIYFVPVFGHLCSSSFCFSSLWLTESF